MPEQPPKTSRAGCLGVCPSLILFWNRFCDCSGYSTSEDRVCGSTLDWPPSDNFKKSANLNKSLNWSPIF